MPRAAGATAEETRARILGAALDLVSEQGYAGTSIRDIAERLDLTKAAMYYHFSSKEQLLDALVAPIADGLADLATRAGTGGETREQLLRDLVRLLSGPGARALSAVVGDPSAIRHLRSRCDLPDLHDKLVRALATSCDDPAAELRARCAVGAVQGAVLLTVRRYASTHPGKPWPGFDDAEVDAVVACAMASLCTPEAARTAR